MRPDPMPCPRCGVESADSEKVKAGSHKLQAFRAFGVDVRFISDGGQGK